MAAEKDVRKAIRSVVAKLPNIQKLKPEQEQCLLSFVGALLPMFDFTIIIANAQL